MSPQPAARSTLPLSDDTVNDFNRDGAVVLRGVFTDWIEPLQSGVEQNMADPGEFGKIYTTEDEEGQFFGDYCNWQRIKPYREFFFDSAAGEIAARLVDSSSIRIFHEHVLVKEPGTGRKTPWHHDQPYYCVDGSKLCSLWIPLDPVDRSVCAEFIAGSHLWNQTFLPTKFSGVAYDRPADGLEKLPDIDALRDDYQILAWDLQPGDAIAFHFMTVHGAPANLSAHRRRAFSARLLGDDAVYAVRGGEMSPPFPGLEDRLSPGSPMIAEEFPEIFSQA
ncbi:phytanoyl-CoA dioxygenase [Chromatiales bacterium (ex Bugula neritina AB1)]|nr:phytanoyl-CoA dioxygenase [Chromatiales bacterium (ex Bugula neritina AB1)]